MLDELHADVREESLQQITDQNTLSLRCSNLHSLQFPARAGRPRSVECIELTGGVQWVSTVLFSRVGLRTIYRV